MCTQYNRNAGRTKMLVLPGGMTLITSNGATILKHLGDADPLVALVYKSCQSFGERHGDGVLRLFFMIHAALDAVSYHPCVWF